MMKKITLLTLALLAGLSPALADPSLWHVKGPKGDAWILGSIHVLPPDVHWRTPAIEAALKKSDIYAFEVSTDEASINLMRDMVMARGFLPATQTLRGMLRPEVLPDFDAAIATSGVDEKLVEHQRPWLAGLQMVLGATAKLGFDPKNGADQTLMAEAKTLGKPTRYLETMADQMAVIAPSDPQLELAEFESSLKEMKDVPGEVQPLVQAWSSGDQKKLDELVNGDMDDYPGARKALLDDRNARWVPQIETWLTEKHTYFITVGAGHLTGPGGVPALLRKAGYKVDGPRADR